jgi:hypothetical protein
VLLWELKVVFLKKKEEEDEKEDVITLWFCI